MEPQKSVSWGTEQGQERQRIDRYEGHLENNPDIPSLGSYLLLNARAHYFLITNTIS